MISENEDAVLIFDLHFKLITSTDGIIAFLNQFKNAEINQSEFYGKVKFQTLVDIIHQNKQLKGKESAFQKELDGMFSEIKLEICRRLRVLIALEKISQALQEDWQKIKVFNSILIDLKQQGLFNMIQKMMEEHKINLGKRFSLEEKYKPFIPNLNGNKKQHHFKAKLISNHPEFSSRHHLWLTALEHEKTFKNRKENRKEISVSELPENLIFEKIIPKIIDKNTLTYNVRTDELNRFKEIFNLNNYLLIKEN
jgi:hypothetical protein